MSSIALWAVRVLRKLPHTRRLDKHLDDCAEVEILRLAFPERPALSIAHVVGAIALPSLEGPYD